MSSTKKLSKDEVLHLAKLAGLTLTEEEIGRYQEQLSNIIGYIEMLDKVKTDNVEPVEQLTELDNVAFDDGTPSARSLSQEEVVQNTKTHKNGHIRVNAIFDNATV
jgi:aspartyl-tRNA(Asn)/glutamyl-tRNA(Gln) amidotransferase subunit C